MLFLSVLIMCSYNNGIKARLTLRSLALLLVCGISCGVADFSQKLFMRTIAGGSAAVFNFYTYVFAACSLLLAFVCFPKEKHSAGSADFRRIFLYILIMAICLFANSYCKTLAAGYLSSVVLYPLNQGCSLILAALMSAVFFKEKLTPKAILGIATAFAGLLIINLL